MNISQYSRGISIAALASLILAAVSYAAYDQSGHGAPHVGLPKILVRTAPVGSRPIPLMVRALGVVNSLGQTTMMATMTGEIEGPFDTQGEIAKGAVVARNVSPLLQDQLATARAQLKYARIVLQRTLDLAQQNLRTDLDVALAQRNLAQAQSSLAALQQQTGMQAMRAPFSGTLHYLVAPGTVVYRGTPVATISGRATPWVDIRVSPADANDLRQGEEAEISVGAWHGQGKVLSIGQNARVWGLIRIRIGISGANPLIPGEWARVLLTQYGTSATTVPRAALVMRGANALVFVIGQHHAHEVHVQILATFKQHAWVKGALHAGETVAVSSVGRLKDGSYVVTNASAGSN
ncbi:efflux RND transporter periplasmic adaptor subunit [Acidocella sp.]|uniref:efflux RND transporter periplasmic adaptor subunit n=1 Tax=Acidocella sp. TaxID=50710 RepID=UPI00262833BE|nr:efflux RND transporter periplasmic adaptor subunit [Acidocella sp.]